MEILEAFDLTKSARSAAELAGCDHKTVAQYVARRDAGLDPFNRVRRPRLVDPYLDKIEEWVENSRAKVRADVAYDKLRAMGFAGDERTVQRAVAEKKTTRRETLGPVTRAYQGGFKSATADLTGTYDGHTNNGSPSLAQ